MYAVRLRGLSTTSAEELLAIVWIALERHAIATPELLIEDETGTGTRLTIGLSFATGREAERIIRAVPMLAASVPDPADWAHPMST